MKRFLGTPMYKIITQLLKYFLVSISSVSTCYSAGSDPAGRNKLTASDPARNIKLADIMTTPCLTRVPQDFRAKIGPALTAFGKMVLKGAQVVDTLKRFKYGNTSVTLLVQFENEKKEYWVLKIAPALEIVANLNIPPEMRNRDLTYPGADTPFGRFVCFTHAWVGDKLCAIDDIDWSQSDPDSLFITFQPYFDGTSNFFKRATPDQYPVWAAKMAQLVCFAEKNHFPLNDLHRDNYRYNPFEKIFGLFDLNPNGEYDIFELLVEDSLVPQLADYEHLKKFTEYPFLPVDLTAIARVLQGVVENGQNDTELTTLIAKAQNYAARGQVPNLSRYTKGLRNAAPDIISTLELFREREQQYDAQIFLPFHEVLEGKFVQSHISEEVHSLLLEHLRKIIRESADEPGSSTLLNPAIVRCHISEVAGPRFGHFMSLVDPLIFVLWFFTRINCNAENIKQVLNLLQLLLRHVIRDKLFMGQYGQPVGSRSLEWKKILKLCPPSGAPS
ncbi:MAG: hypothetical protein LBC25_00245 [Holosporales bacterium]|jgi:hypothetical protein|nr:hypothetical protein [Holosporales bacterium]